MKTKGGGMKVPHLRRCLPSLRQAGVRFLRRQRAEMFMEGEQAPQGTPAKKLVQVTPSSPPSFPSVP